jgi:hypothetical protein
MLAYRNGSQKANIQQHENKHLSDNTSTKVMCDRNGKKKTEKEKQVQKRYEKNKNKTLSQKTVEISLKKWRYRRGSA